MHTLVDTADWPDVAPPIVVIHASGNDHWTCRTWIRGHGECMAVVPLPPDGTPPQRCWRGHPQPWLGTATSA